ncbi:DUF4402 domain-containing protein [Sphingomonas sp. ASV193]|uniref:DUF4402 domain-containing protein n=1 Tax=Sphingomonas sp. ASV193 TaxID=3144405 RepID=UPI0032E92998
MNARTTAAILAIGLAFLAPVEANAATANATVTAKVVKPLTLTGGGTVAFGNIFTPSTATYTGNFVISAAASQSGTYCATGFTCTGTTGSALFNLTGTNNTPLTVNIPNTVTLTNAANASTITVTTSNSLGANVSSGNYVTSLANSGSPGTNFYVGGSMTVSDATVEGSYSGTFTVTANYN